MYCNVASTNGAASRLAAYQTAEDLLINSVLHVGLCGVGLCGMGRLLGQRCVALWQFTAVLLQR